jgi:hypothetical protein
MTAAYWATLATAAAGMTGWAVTARRLHAVRRQLAERDDSARRAVRNAGKIFRVVTS